MAHKLHPSDIALQDTASYNKWFNTIVTLRDKAEAEPDSARKAQYTEAMHGVVSHMESSLSDDSTVVDIGPMLDMWEVEGGKSFGAFSEQMAEEELEASFQEVVSEGTDLSLSGEQRSVAVEGLNEKKAVYDNKQRWADEWAGFRATAETNMTTLWERYEAIRDTDPDKSWLGESRFVWWGMATPDNAIQEEIAALGREYRNWDMARLNGPPAAAIKMELSHAEKAYTKALNALENLKGE